MRTTRLLYLIALSFFVSSTLAQQPSGQNDWLPMEKEETHPFQVSPKMPDELGSAIRQEIEHEALPNSLGATARFVPRRDPEMPSNVLLSEGERRLLNRQVNCYFYGTSFPIHYDSRTFFRTGTKLQNYQITQYWRQIENSQHDLLIKQIRRQAQNLFLNDWGLGQLINSTAEKIFPNDRNAQVLFALFAFSEMGYSAKVCQEGVRLYLMLPSEQIVYGATYLREGRRKYYLLDFDGDLPEVRSARLVDLNYNETGKSLDIDISKIPRFPLKPIHRKLDFDYKGENYQYVVRLNRNLLKYYNGYPFTDLDIRFGTPLSIEARYSLLPQLRSSMKEMNETEAVNFLLRFVQHAFGYQTDSEQFGRERYLFAEQTLYFANSDCEDRSALFGYLVKELLGLETIGLLFPGHVATAVKFSEPANGTYFKYRGGKYFVCDPTYINATYGMVIPDVRGENATVIHFR